MAAPRLSAQHGGDAHGGFSPSAAAPHAASPTHILPATASSRGTSTPRNTFGTSGNRGGSGAQTLFPPPGINYDVNRSLFPPLGVTSTQPLFGSNGARRFGEGDRRSERERSPYGGVGIVTLGYPAYFGFGNDPELLEATENPNEAPNSDRPSGYAPTNAYPPGYGAPASLQSNLPSRTEDLDEPEQDSAPSPYVAAPRASTQAAASKATAPLPEEDTVVIIFKDGRPPEQIRNYALTRTMLYVTSGRVRTIPVEQIDVAATEKINEKTGVEFHLPSRP